MMKKNITIFKSVFSANKCVLARQVDYNRKKPHLTGQKSGIFWNLLYTDITHFSRMTNSSVNFEKAITNAFFFFSNHSLYTRLLLLLVFGSRPGDLTEGTLVGIGDATNNGS